VISVPNIAHASRRLMLLQGRFDYADMGILDDTHLKFFTRKSITDLLETCGFVVEVMDWVEAKVSESELHEVLDPLGLANLEEVVKAFSDWEATAYQYIIKAFPASEEDRVRRLSEEKVQVERRVRELEGQVVGLEKRVAEFERVKKWAEDLQEHAESLMVEVDRLRACIKELETVIVEKESRIHALQSTVAKRDRTIADMEGRRG
jgi:DNA repair exonuclease SbcCD ATPase subunit